MAADSAAWMPLYIGDYLADTMHLDCTEHGAYLLLIMHYWRTGPLPDDDRALAAIARCERKQWDKTVSPVVRQFFHVEDGRLHHKRINQELATADAHIEQRRAAGKASAAKRAIERKPTETPNEIPNENPTTVESSLPAPLQRNAIPSPSPSPSPSPVEEDSVLRTALTPKQILFSEGLDVVRELTRKERQPAATLIGGWLKLAGSDDQHVLDVIRDAARERPIEPVSWIVAALKARKNGHSLPFDPGKPYYLDHWADEWAESHGGELKPIKGKPAWCINGYPVADVAITVGENIHAAGGELAVRPRLDPIAGWCRDDLPAEQWFPAMIRRVVQSLPEPRVIRSLAVFDAAVRERSVQ